MDTYTQAPRGIFIDLVQDPSPSLSVEDRNDADAARSERNILLWKAYLPEDCVKTMIQMGWDVTT